MADSPPDPRWRRRARAAGASAAIAALTLALALPFLSQVFAHREPGGWDGICHYAIGARWSDTAFPDLYSWSPEVFAGTPFPTFYPPLLFAIVAILARLGMAPALAFWSVQLAACLAIPLLVQSIARRLCRAELPGLVAGALAAGFLVDHAHVSDFGVSLHATFNLGLVAQTVSFVAFLVFLRTLLDAHRSTRAQLISALALAAVPLSNVHVVWDALFFFVGVVALRVGSAPRAERWTCLRPYLAIGVCAVLLSACWIAPMLARLELVPTKVLEVPPAGSVLYGFLRVGVYSALALAAAWVERDREVLGLGLGLGLLLLFGAVPVVTWIGLEDLAIQPARFLAAFLYVGAVLVGYLVARVGRLARWPRAGPFVAVAVVALFFAYVEPIDEVQSHLPPDESRALERLGARLERDGGRYLSEHGRELLGFHAECLPARFGARSATGVHRESSINSMFAPALRNSVSLYDEHFGTDSRIDGLDALESQSAERHEARFETFGVRWLLMREPRSIAALRERLQVREVGREGPWRLFERDTGGDAVVPSRRPALTFAPFDAKTREDDGYDFIRLSEEMFVAGRLSIPLVRARRERVEDAEHLERFGAVVLTHYPSADVDAAFSALERFSRTRPVIAIEGDAPLFARLAALAADRESVRIVRRVSASTERRRVRATVGRLLDELEARVAPLTDAPTVERVSIDRQRVRVHLDRAPTQPVPVWIRQGYFPDWRGPDGEPVYLATPSFQMVFVETQDAEVRWTKPPAVYIGWGLSALGALALLGLVLTGRGRRRTPRSRSGS